VLAVLLAFGCAYAWQVRLRIVELREPWALAVRPTWQLLMTLPGRPPVELYHIANRIGRSGLWPWDDWLLMMSCDAMMAAKNPHLVLLCTAAAPHSQRSLDRLYGWREHADEPTRRAAIVGAAQSAERLSDEQLGSLLDSAARLRFMGATPEMLLIEMLHRRRPEFRQQLLLLSVPPPKNSLLNRPSNLPAVAALRRWDGQSAPLKVFLQSPLPLESGEADLPVLSVSIQNVDVQHAVVSFHVGGDYRSGRQARWRIEVQRSDGSVLPLKPRRGFAGGGISSRRLLAHGESYEAKLDMDDYVGPLTPGLYSVIVRYHDECAIADMEDISRLITFSSDPFELIVHPADVDSGPATD
jgi:hypothetical protein